MPRPNSFSLRMKRNYGQNYCCLWSWRHGKITVVTEIYDELIKIPRAKDIIKSENYSNLDSIYKQTEEFIEDKYPVDIKYNLEIDCRVTQNGYRPMELRDMLAKHFPLKADKRLEFFIVTNDVDKPYEIKWKVLNRGEEAEKGI